MITKKIICYSSTCPVLGVDFDERLVTIADDYGSTIKITIDEFEKAYQEYFAFKVERTNEIDTSPTPF